MTLVKVLYERKSFPNAWVELVKDVMENGTEITFGGKIKDKDQYEKKKAKELNMIVVLEKNALEEAINGMLHPQFPTKELHKIGYVREWDRGYDYIKQGFLYNYENRCEAYEPSWSMAELQGKNIIDQWKLAKEDLINQITTGIQSNRNEITIANPSIDRFEIPDSPPCLRSIWLRWDGKKGIEIDTDWRSRDLFAAWPVNIVGLLAAIKREIIESINKELNDYYRIIQYVDRSKSLHIYEYYWDDALKVEPLTLSPQLM